MDRFALGFAIFTVVSVMWIAAILYDAKRHVTRDWREFEQFCDDMKKRHG